MCGAASVTFLAIRPASRSFLIRDSPCAAELSEFFADFEQSFLDGQPFEFAEVAYEMFAL